MTTPLCYGATPTCTGVDTAPVLLGFRPREPINLCAGCRGYARRTGIPVRATRLIVSDDDFRIMQDALRHLWPRAAGSQLILPPPDDRPVLTGRAILGAAVAAVLIVLGASAAIVQFGS